MRITRHARAQSYVKMPVMLDGFFFFFFPSTIKKERKDQEAEKPDQGKPPHIETPESVEATET
jgi:hypothetical protein